MKTIRYSALSALLAFVIVSCTKNKATNSSNANNNLKMQVVALNGGTTQTTDATAPGAGDSVITTLDLLSYNAKTGEVIFSNATEALQKIGALRSKVNVYVQDKYQFSLIYANDILSNLYNEPVLYRPLLEAEAYKDNITEKGKWYIRSGYPSGVVLNSGVNPTDPQSQSWENLRKSNFKKMEPGWNLFIEELKKAGKYIN